ncbi:DcuS/MalK family sensor histidine kinase [Oceanobacillus kimchii]|uniref:DcuS/MalK family sensor histidine kinase n=1 Tax=Oceanobacillus kimchii TaxID=746691 RepID=UPI0009853FA3|nr:DcuS/MalK family sensor histidine kinase [Oceanobacillus kimchii]
MGKKKTRLSVLITTLVCLVVIIVLITNDLLINYATGERLKENIEEKAVIISRTMAKSEWVINGLQNKDEEKYIQEYTNEISRSTDLTFIVVMDMNGIRKSHPNSELIGKPFVGGDEDTVLEQGIEHISISEGTLGDSLRAFSPIFNGDGEQIGAVSVGISLQEINDVIYNNHISNLISSIVGLIIGILGAWFIARYIKRILFGLEPFQIAKMLKERSATLESAREGIITIDTDHKITIVNKAAMKVFEKAGITESPVGKSVEQVLPHSHLEEILESKQPAMDVEQKINGVTILANRMPIVVNDEVVGAISTFRDLTELKQLAKQLSGVKLYAEALRAQSHEFMNKLHVINGMVTTKSYNELDDYIKQIVNQRNEELNHVVKNVKDSILAGFLLGKLSDARERDVNLQIDIAEEIPAVPDNQVVHKLITVIGNLIDNAIDAIISKENRTIDMYVSYKNDWLYIGIQDYGVGIDENTQQQMFQKGYSTKGNNRGYGLYLVKQSVEALGGSLRFETLEAGTIFEVEVPYKIRRDIR